MKINKIAIACFKKDLFLLRPCVASIRFWYPDIEILLIKDLIKGDFCTREIETTFHVKIFPTERKQFGWPWSKLAIVLHEKKDKYLFLDSDIVLLGRVLESLEQYDADFVVTGMEQPDIESPTINSHYIDMKRIATFDPTYIYPGYGFNGGQIVMTSGVLNERDFETVISFEPSITNKHPEIFKHGDQGALNYAFAKANQNGKIKVRYADFWIWPGVPAANSVDLQKIKAGEGIPYVLHWAGAKPTDFRKYSRYDILRFFEDEYYRKVPFGALKQWFGFTTRLLVAKAKILKYTIFRMKHV